MAHAPAPDLVTAFHDWLDHCIDEKGVEIPHGLVLGHDDKLTVLALAVDPSTAYRVMLGHWHRDPLAREMIFALDRFTKPGQGTTLGDVMAGHHFTRAGSRPFVIEYQHAPRIVKPICWDNFFWNGELMHELAAAVSQR